MDKNSSVPPYFEELKIQVIDDQEYMRSVLSSILRAFSIRHVAEYADASTAFNELKAFDANLILTDWQMKPVDGLQLVRRIRIGKDSPNPFVPIVMVTGHNNVDKAMQARNAGANDFLVKPVSAKSVYLRIRSTMENPQPFVRSKTYFGPDRRRCQLAPPWEGGGGGGGERTPYRQGNDCRRCLTGRFRVCRSAPVGARSRARVTTEPRHRITRMKHSSPARREALKASLPIHGNTPSFRTLPARGRSDRA